MRFLRPLLTGILLGASAPALVAPVLAQTCVCPPPDQNLNAGPVSYGGPAIMADEPPPPLPEYDQPPPPSPGYIWTPGYWSYNNDDYYWVPGLWVEPPHPGVLWTPGYWAFQNGVYLFTRGYWGPRMGFYGGVNYGYGYFGQGYQGGRWDGDRFYYNSAVNNLGPRPPQDVYHAPVTINNTVVNNVTTLNTINTVNRTSFVGGPQGVRAAPTPQERQAGAEQRLPPTAQQRRQVRAAAVDPHQFLDANKGKPPVAATRKAADFKGPDVVPARAAGGPVSPAPNAPGAAPNERPEKLPPGGKPVAPGQPVVPPVVAPVAPSKPPGLAPGPNGQLRPQPGVKPAPTQPAIAPPATAPVAPVHPAAEPARKEPAIAPKPEAVRPAPAAPKPAAAPRAAPDAAAHQAPRPPVAKPLEGANRAPPAAQMKPPSQPVPAQLRQLEPHPAMERPRLEPGKPGERPHCGLPGLPPCPK